MNETISALEKERDGVRQKERDLTRKIVDMRKIGNAGSKTSNFHKWQAAIGREKKERFEKMRLQKMLLKALVMLEISDQGVSALTGLSEKRIAVTRGSIKAHRPSFETDLAFLASRYWQP
jgi:hypothetical protein